MAGDNPPVLVDLKKIIKDLNIDIRTKQKQRLKLERLLKKKCPHPVKSLRFKIGWFPSSEDADLGYKDPSMPEIWCVLCDFRETGSIPSEVLKKWDHSWIPDALATYEVLRGVASLGEYDESSEFRERAGKEFLRSLTR